MGRNPSVHEGVHSGGGCLMELYKLLGCTFVTGYALGVLTSTVAVICIGKLVAKKAKP